MPKMKGSSIKLVCSNCGKWRKIKKEDDYKIGEKKKKKKSEEIAVVEEEKKKKKRRKEEQYDIDTDDAHAELYDTY
ncbi:MAG: hypothetical protein KGY45_04250 [Hadesarchaea archaeon]|nr:hypothetical protein [Hadesarchaea archaeon]